MPAVAILLHRTLRGGESTIEKYSGIQGLTSLLLLVIQ